LKKLSGTVVLNIPEIDNDLAGDLGNNGDAVSLILKVAFTRANLEEALVKLGKLAEPKPTPSILKFIATVVLPARTTRFVPKDAFVVNTKPGSHVKIGYIDPDLIRWFGDKIEEPTAEATLRQYVITRLSAFAPFMKEIRDGGIATKTTPGELYSMMEKQPDGPKSDAGPLLTNGYANLFEMDDVNGVARLVDARWGVGSGGWSVCADDASHSSQWRDGHRVFSRDSR
jgi:hypothetical protein